MKRDDLDYISTIYDIEATRRKSEELRMEFWYRFMLTIAGGCLIALALLFLFVEVS